MKRWGAYCVISNFIFAGLVIADEAETKGGLKIVSDDGNFSAELGGRIHFDTYIFDKDLKDPVNTTDFRRARLSMKGKLWKWEYKLERDFASDGTGGLRDVYLATKFFNGKLTIGNFKPSRSINELTSSNEIILMEYAFTSAAGIYDGRGRQQGIGWRTHWSCHTLGLNLFNLRNPGDPRNSGFGAAARLTWAPINDDNSTVHLGVSRSFEKANQASLDIIAEVAYAGRRGPDQLIAISPGGSEYFFGEFGDDEFFLGDSGGRVNITGFELAATYGPLFGQAEYAFGHFTGGLYLSELIFEELYGAPPNFFCDPITGCFIGGQDVHAWYIMGSWAITGQHKPYDAKTGIFKSIKPSPPEGAWEIAARYNTIENRDFRQLRASNFTFGVNYYFNPKVRVMMNITLGDDDFTGDKTNQFAVRLQGAW
ncbi:OprO/OprP family phosphate-selective porin [Microbulbifer sp. OS29]|uniref:OprO/OprP family phosphate-selective porin n=1 Tax=Microbulbifer okhotskensis TaxID=2926617 RepID=A0A9X2EKX2_9GAMM|nr:porin [Microbulbifer okhotskensis]MCO1334087.1 OprO/OprP family phosphate-selective porin [Microbulbifer okhotskensis]